MSYYLDGKYKIENDSDHIQYSSIYSSPYSDCRLIELDDEKQKEINYRSFADLPDFYNSRDSFFKEFEKDCGIDLWFLEHFRLYFEYRNFQLKLQSINIFIENHPQGRILSSDNLLRLFFNPEVIESPSSFSISKSKKINWIYEFRQLLSNWKRKKSSQSKILLMSKIQDNSSGIDKRFGSIQEKYDKLLCRNILDQTLEPLSRYGLNKQDLHSDHAFSRYIFSLRWITDFYKFNRSFHKLINDLKKSAKDSKNSQVIYKLFARQKFSFLLYFLKYKAFHFYFKKSKIKGIFLSDENSPQHKVFQYAAHQNNVKTFALQHGTIHDLHPAYIYGAYSKKPLLPDITFSWGEKFTRMLNEIGGYAKNQVLTVGRIEPIGIKRTINPKLDKERKIIVFATQPQRDPQLRELQLIDVFESIKQIDGNYQLVIRPHPNEKDDEYFLSIARKVSFTDFLIDRISDLKTHFEICSILITSFSTVGAEFVPFRKPMLILDYLKQDLIGYIASGVGIQISNQQDLIENLNHDQINIDQKAFDRFIKDYFYKIDNKTEDRILEKINEQ